MTVSSTSQLRFPGIETLNPATPLVLSSLSANSGLVDPLAGRSLSASSVPISRPLPYPGNNYNEAEPLGIINGRVLYLEEIGGEINLDPGIDLRDFIEIRLPTDGDLTLSLTGLQTDADLYLMRDFDNDRIPELSDVIDYSTYIGSNTSEFIQVSGLSAGTYYVFIDAWQARQTPGRPAYTTYTLSVTADAAGETLSTARNIGSLNSSQTNSSQTFIDYLGTTDPYARTSTIDPSDVYRFQLETISTVQINLSGLTADADVYLIQDVNRNGVVDSDSEILRRAIANGTTPDSINLGGLVEGDYYIWVTQGIPGSNTNYTLQLSATPIEDFGQTYSTAVELGVLTGQQGFQGSVNSAGDPGDLYGFSLDTPSALQLNLSNLSADANLFFVRDANNNNVVDSADVIVSSTQAGELPETIIYDELPVGRYFAYVASPSNGSTNYALTFTADGAGGNYFTARNIGVLNTTQTFTDWVGGLDTLDTYRFQLGTSNTVAISLDGLSANANLYLARDVNGNGQYDVGEVLLASELGGTLSERIQTGLAAGTYFVFVERASGNTNYTLSLSTAVQIQTGTFRAETFTPDLITTRTVVSGNGNVNFGSGARDTLDLSGVVSSAVQLSLVGINGGVAHNPGNGTRLFDRILLPNGHEILFEGIDVIQFADSVFSLSNVPNDPLFNQQSNLHMIGVHNAWRFTTGASNVAIGVEDTGLGLQAGAIHPDLDPSRTLINSTNYQDEFFYVGEQALEPYSHGTAAQSVIAATSNNGLGMSGINWQATVYNADVLGGNSGDLLLANATRAMIQEANNRGQRLIVNLSLRSLTGASQLEFEQVVAENPNVLFIISSGNEFQPSLAYPASLAQRYSNVIAIGAVEDNGIRANYSNYGPGLGLVGPTQVIAAQASITPTGSVNFSYLGDFDGTSAAAPHIAGVASLVWSANPNLTATQVYEILGQTAYDLGTPSYDLEYGFGMVNADAAVRRALALAQNPSVA